MLSETTKQRIKDMNILMIDSFGVEGTNDHDINVALDAIERFCKDNPIELRKSYSNYYRENEGKADIQSYEEYRLTWTSKK